MKNSLNELEGKGDRVKPRLAGLLLAFVQEFIESESFLVTEDKKEKLQGVLEELTCE